MVHERAAHFLGDLPPTLFLAPERGFVESTLCLGHTLEAALPRFRTRTDAGVGRLDGFFLQAACLEAPIFFAHDPLHGAIHAARIDVFRALLKILRQYVTGGFRKL